MKGFTKAVKRTPFMVTTKVGMNKKSNDPEFDDWNRNFSMIEQATEKLIKDTKAYMDAVNGSFVCSASYASHYSVIMHPMAGEYDLIGSHPEAEKTIKSIDKFESSLQELKDLISPELQLVETRILVPTKEFQGVLKTIRKTITKREHKLTDYDRFNNSLTKLRDKKEKTMSDEKNLFKLEQDFEVATNEYEYINTTLKQDLPQFFALATQFIDPLFHSFFYMQLNIYYLMMEKMNSFSDETKYDISNIPGAEIAANYEEARTDAWAQIEDLHIVKRIISVAKLVQAQRSAQGEGRAPGEGLSRAGTSASSLGKPRVPPPSGSSFKSPPPPPPSSSGFKKAPPPPPPSMGSSAPPPPYTPASGVSKASSVAAATKRPPPPPPPLKPKPSFASKPKIQYVVAVYDFAAQADGDLSFSAGDRIEIVERSANTEDWWTGRLNGQQGVFPGNYVQDT